MLQNQRVLMIFALIAPVGLAQGTVTGAATYRERIALPGNAVLEVTLEDVSRAGAPAEVIGRARVEHPGQPPFRFSIQYDPSRIVSSHSYAVRARVTVEGQLMFTTDQRYPVLTQGSGSDAGTIIMRRVTGRGPLADLPASFSGVLPCADCPGIRYLVNLFPDKSFFLRTTYLERGVAVDDAGRWTLSTDGTKLLLQGEREMPWQYALKGDVLSRLDSEGREIDARYQLRRKQAFEPIEPRLQMRGMFRYMADAAVFTECASGQRWPVAMERDYKTLEAAYLKSQHQAGEELLVTLEGQAVMRPKVDGAGETLTLVAERYGNFWPGETCGTPFARESLRDTYWRLTRIGDKPVILAERQREPNLVFRTEQDRVTGFSGCNNLTGSYTLNGGELSFGALASTRMACIQGGDTEAAFLAVLDQVRGWKIFGQHLELYNAAGQMLARFEARAL